MNLIHYIIVNKNIKLLFKRIKLIISKHIKLNLLIKLFIMFLLKMMNSGLYLISFY
jgi:hypothetical protein